MCKHLHNIFIIHFLLSIIHACVVPHFVVTICDTNTVKHTCLQRPSLIQAKLCPLIERVWNRGN